MASTPPASWYPDPTGRYELRYWAGTNWTQHVASQGHQTADPVEGVLYPPTVVVGGRNPGWYSDPLGRYAQRYWDGHQWTDEVSPPVSQVNDAPLPRSATQGTPFDKRISKQVRNVGNTAPVGGGTLFTEQVLVVNQKVKKLGSGVGYTVYDQTGRPLGAVQEVGRGLGSKMSDNLRGRSDKNRSYRFRVVDHENRVILGMTRPEKWFTAKSHMVVEGPTGAPIGHITQDSYGVLGGVTSFAREGLGAAGSLVRMGVGGITGVAAGAAADSVARPLASKTKGLDKIGHVRFGLEANGERLGSIHAESIKAWDFSVHDTKGTEIGRITKTWAGWAKERFTKSDNYVVQMHRPLQDPLLSLVIAAALALDIALKQGDPTRGSGSTRRYQ